MARHDAARIRSLVRARAGLLVAGVVLPLALFGLFERQARRLDALAARGRPVEATVTAVTRDSTHYAYRVEGALHTWNVARRDAPYAPGETFVVTYLPGDAGLSRPTADRSVGAEEAARNRGFSRKVVLGLAVILLGIAGLAHRDLQRLRSGTMPDPTDPRVYRKRLWATSGVLLAVFALVSGLHARDALAKGESPWPVVIGLALAIAIVGGVFVVAGRAGPVHAKARLARAMRWIVPAAVALALLRLAAMLIVSQ